MLSTADKAENRIQNEGLIEIYDDITPRIELATFSNCASSGRGAASKRTISERRENTGITASFENASNRINIFNLLNANGET